MDGKIRTAVESILKLLVDNDFKAAAARTAGVRLSEQEMREAVRRYGRTLVSGANEQLDAIDAVEVKNASPSRWSVNVPLWTREEGRSDLTLELTLIDEGDALRTEIDDIHVL
jgi:hypothetical protein